MKSIWRLVAAVLATAFLAGCFQATTALEPQNKTLSASEARIYILRPRAWAFGAHEARITINGTDVGVVANNSFLSVDRPPGKYRLKVDVPLDLGSPEHEIEVAAGRSYYFVINMKSSTFMAGGVVVTMPERQNGRPVGQGGLLSTTYIGELDANAGSALLAQIKSER